MLINQIRLHTSLAESRVGIFLQKPTFTTEDKTLFFIEFTIT